MERCKKSNGTSYSERGSCDFLLIAVVGGRCGAYKRAAKAFEGSKKQEGNT
jgi:hypothetical protein